MKIYILAIAFMIATYGQSQSLQQIILSDSSNQILPDSLIESIKGKWNWTNGRDSFSISFIENSYYDYGKLFGKPDLCALLGFWHYRRYNSVELGSRVAYFSRDSSLSKSNNIFDVYLSRIWNPQKFFAYANICLKKSSKSSISVSLKLVDKETMLLLFDGNTGEMWSKPENDLFFEFLIPSNIVLKKAK